MSADERRSTSPSMQVVAEIAAAKDVDTIELDPLSNRLDLEAMDALFQNSTEEIRIECILDDLRVEVEADGSVRVSSLPSG